MEIKNKNPYVTLIIVNYNGKKYLHDCFSSLKNLNYDKKKLKIIMVDNQSQDGSVAFVKKNFPDIKIIRNKINNYCKALNTGIKRTKTELIGILNNDTKVEKNWLIKLVEILNQDDKIGGVTGKTLLFDKKLQGTGHRELPNLLGRQGVS